MSKLFSVVRRVSELTSGTPLHTPLKLIFNELRPLYIWLLNGYYRIATKSGKFYRIDISNESVHPFWLSIPGGTATQLWRIRGEWEPEVTDALMGSVESDSVFWEVGAAWGYFSMAVAPLVSEVVAFEAIPERVKDIESSAKKNGYDNIKTVSGIVGESIALEHFSVPDVILMDVEGFEWDIISQNQWLLEEDVTLCIEIHESRGHLPSGSDPRLNPDGVLEILRQHGYIVEKIDGGGSNYHVMARPR